RSLTINNVKEGTHLRLAHGKSIEKISDTSYLVDGNYYISTLSAHKIRTINGTKELIVAVPQSGTVSYFLSW
ncbi:MAG TPA: hypothetical protein PKD85_16775, partial [Saprospiraceae bacterium]|nr:hypothetical protein [Saprospiraceae bacterium]